MALVAVLMPVVFFIDRGETRFILWVYVIGNVLANCHLKNLLGLLCMAASIGLTSLSSFVLGLRPSVQGALIAFPYLLLYYAVFLGVFFHSNYRNAKKTDAV